jgi:predicted AlkP superfamily phosphohydrolase/phosphomutase
MVKFALIGLDSAIPSLVSKYFGLGKLPNMKTLARQGTWTEILPVFPSHTASNWNTIATGAWPKTHGVVDMVVHLPKKPLTEIVSGFYSGLCQAEQIWLTAERFGRKNILMKYIGSWPPNIKSGIQVEGFGAPGGPGSRPWGSSPLALNNSSCFCTKPLQNATEVRFSKAQLSLSDESTTALVSESEPTETEIVVGPPEGKIKYNIVLLNSGSSKAYDTVRVSKDGGTINGLSEIFLRKGQLSEWIFDEFRVNGKMTKAAFRMKLMDLDFDAERTQRHVFKLFVSQIFPLEGWTFPNNVALDLVKRFGPFLESISHFPYAFGWVDEDTYLEDLEYQAKWMENATDYLMNTNSWDLYMTQWHGIDNTQHAFLRFDKSVLTERESELSDRVVQRSYEIADDFVGNIVKATRNNNDNEEVYTFVISDHGHVMGKRRFFINQYLHEQGLIKLRRDTSTGKITIDWDKTQAFAQGMVYVYINLKGRDPAGSVNPGKEYEDLIERLIDLLYDLRDPKTGARPIRLALSNKDSEFLGLSGERVGDVVFAVNPVYVSDNRMKFSEDLFENLKTGLPDGSIHGQQLPSVDLGKYGTIRSLLIAQGPRIKKGYVMKTPVKMVDIAPTIAHILDIPAPKNSEGNIIQELFD